MAHRDAAQDDDHDITPLELAARVGHGDGPLLLDVREPHEHAYARIEGARLIPLRALPTRATELDPLSEIVVYCHHGVRSEHAVVFLRNQGFTRARNLAGGIDRWSTDVDPAVPRY
jgi:adenylyltransferase/sulfurtransferase